MCLRLAFPLAGAAPLLAPPLLLAQGDDDDLADLRDADASAGQYITRLVWQRTNATYKPLERACFTVD